MIHIKKSVMTSGARRRRLIARFAMFPPAPVKRAAEEPYCKVSCVSKCKQMDEPLYVHDPFFHHALLAPCHLDHTLHTSPPLLWAGGGPANHLRCSVVPKTLLIFVGLQKKRRPHSLWNKTACCNLKLPLLF